MMIALQYNGNSNSFLYIERNFDYFIWQNLFPMVILSTFDQFFSNSFEYRVKIIPNPCTIKKEEAIKAFSLEREEILCSDIKEIKEKDEIVELPEPRSRLQKISDSIQYILFPFYPEG